MRGWKVFSRKTLVVAALCLFSLVCFVWAQPAISASLTIKPDSGAPTGAVAFIGAGFKPGEGIELIMVLDDVPTELGSKPMIKKADDSGAFTFKGNIPRTATPGMHKIEAIGDQGTVAEATLNVVKAKKKK